MCYILRDIVKSPLDILRYVPAHRLHELLPNVSVALLRIVLTVPDSSNISGERSFPKLIKTYLRANITLQRVKD